MLSIADGICKLKRYEMYDRYRFDLFMLDSKWRYPNRTWHQTHLTTRSAASSDCSSNWCSQGNIMIWVQRMLTRSNLRRKPMISCRRRRLLRRLIPPYCLSPTIWTFLLWRGLPRVRQGHAKKIQSIRVNALKPTNTPLPHVLPTSETFCIALHSFGRGGQAAGRWLPSTRLVYIKETHVVFVLRSAAGMNP